MSVLRDLDVALEGFFERRIQVDHANGVDRRGRLMARVIAPVAAVALFAAMPLIARGIAEVGELLPYEHSTTCPATPEPTPEVSMPTAEASC